MHTADAAGGKNLDTGHMGNDHGGGNGGCAVLAPGAQHSQIAAGCLVDCLTLLAEVLNLLGGKAGLQAAADDGNGGRNSTLLPDDGFHSQRGLHVLRIGHTVGNDGGFQCHNGLALCDGSGDFGIDVQILVHVHFVHLFLYFKYF